MNIAGTCFWPSKRYLRKPRWMLWECKIVEDMPVQTHPSFHTIRRRFKPRHLVASRNYRLWITWLAALQAVDDRLARPFVSLGVRGRAIDKRLCPWTIVGIPGLILPQRRGLRETVNEVGNCTNTLFQSNWFLRYQKRRTDVAASHKRVLDHMC